MFTKIVSSRIEVYVTKINSFFKLFFERFVDSNINNAAIVIAYNALLAIFPTVILVGNLLPLLNLKADTIMSYLQTAVPPTIYKTLNPLVRTFLTSGSGGIASVSALVAIWAASRGINALKRAINDAYGVDSQSAFMTRIVSIAIIFVFAIFLVALFIFFSFGQLALEKLSPILNLPLSWLDTFRSVKWPTTILGIFAILCLIYRFLPNAKVHWRCIFPGAVLGTAGWLLITQGFSIYVYYFAQRVLSYGALGTFIVLLFWLNYSGWTILLGAVVNASLEYCLYGKVTPRRPTFRRILDNVIPKKDNS